MTTAAIVAIWLPRLVRLRTVPTLAALSTASSLCRVPTEPVIGPR